MDSLVEEVGPVDGRAEDLRALEPQRVRDLGRDRGRRRRGEREDGHARELLAQDAEALVVGAELRVGRRLAAVEARLGFDKTTAAAAARTSLPHVAQQCASSTATRARRRARWSFSSLAISRREEATRSGVT